MKQTQGCDYLVFDISNLLYRAFYSQKDEDSETVNGMAIHIALTTLNKYYKIYKPTKRVVMTFDRSSWRKEFTANNPHLKPYKGNRRQDMTAEQLQKYANFQEHLLEFENLIKDHTAIVTLFCDRLEADDLMAGFVQYHPNDKIVIITADSDIAQLFKHDNVTIVSPATDKPQSLDKYDNDPEYYLFQKCVRGDSTDNIQPAYPRVRQTRIKEVYEDARDGDGYKFLKFMKETWRDHLGVEYLVEKAFKDNQTLIDLEKQPTDIRELICTTIQTELDTKKQFSLFHFLKFLGKHELNKIKESIDNFVPMLSKR